MSSLDYIPVYNIKKTKIEVDFYTLQRVTIGIAAPRLENKYSVSIIYENRVYKIEGATEFETKKLARAKQKEIINLLESGNAHIIFKKQFVQIKNLEDKL